MPNPSIPNVFAIVLNYNGGTDVIECLKSLYRSDYPSLEIVVIDNDSKDRSLKIIKELFQKSAIIQNASNIGFAAGNNVGIRFALEKFADYIFLLNNDATVEPDTISLLVGYAEHNSGCGIVSPLILKEKNGSAWFAGGEILWTKMRAVHAHYAGQTNAFSTQYASGCAMLVSKAVFKEIGLFDEDYFLYYEDADFSLRAKKNGFGISVLPSAAAYHKEASNSNNALKTYWLVLSALIFFKKNTPRPLRPQLGAYLILRRIKNACTVIFTPNKDAKLVRKAYADFRTYSRRKK